MIKKMVNCDRKEKTESKNRKKSLCGRKIKSAKKKKKKYSKSMQTCAIVLKGKGFTFPLSIASTVA